MAFWNRDPKVDGLWLQYESIEDTASESVEDFEAALEEFRALAESLEGTTGVEA